MGSVEIPLRDTDEVSNCFTQFYSFPMKKSDVQLLFIFF